MRASSFRYLVKNGVRNLWNNRMMTIASVGITDRLFADRGICRVVQY